MPGNLDASFDLDMSGDSLPLTGTAAPLWVCAYDPTGGGLSVIPNVFPLRTDRREGGMPSSASFVYMFDDAMAINFGWPSRFEQVFGVYSTLQGSPWVVLADQRIVILSQYPDGSPMYLFDGYAQVQQASVAGGGGSGAPGHERVTFEAIGVESRAWDAPIAGRLQRSSQSGGAAPAILDTTGRSDVQTDLPVRFNPAHDGPGVTGGQRPNRTPKGADTAPSRSPGVTYPVFVEPGWYAPGLAWDPDYWNVGGAVRYLLAQWNDQSYVHNPDFSTLDKLLKSYELAEGSAVLNPADPSTYTVSSVRVPDLDASNRPWPEVVAHLVSYCGFLVRWDLSADADGNPQTTLTFYRRDEFASVAPKSLYLQAAGSGVVNVTASNTTRLELACDWGSIVNAQQVETAQRRVEVSDDPLPAL